MVKYTRSRKEYLLNLKMKSKFYDINKTLSYNCLFNFIIGNRGGGKTYGFKKWAIRSFLKTGKQFVYVRRYKQELKNIGKFFDDIRGEFPDIVLEVKKNAFYIDGKQAGTCMALSTAKIEKSVAFPEVDKICYDEFILDKGVYHYLPDEVTNFLELYETIARMRDVTCMFLSNAITVTNPYFLYFDISLPYGKTIQRQGDLLIELVQNQEYIEEKNKTRFAQIVKDTAYGKYAIENQFLRDNKNFVCRKTAGSHCYFLIDYMDATFGVWIDYTAGVMTVSEDIDPYCGLRYALTNADHKPNTLFLKNPRKSIQFENFCRQYMLGNVRFESINLKNICNEVIKWTL